MIKDKQSKKNQQTKQKQSAKKTHIFNLFSMRINIRKYTAKSD